MLLAYWMLNGVLMALMDQVKKSYTTSQYYPFVQNIAIYLFTQEIIMRHLYVLGIVGICYLLTHKTPVLMVLLF